MQILLKKLQINEYFNNVVDENNLDKLLVDFSKIGVSLDIGKENISINYAELHEVFHSEKIRELIRKSQSKGMNSVMFEIYNEENN